MIVPLRLLMLLSVVALLACGETKQSSADQDSSKKEKAPATPLDTPKIPVLLDTDANNELDDQHAIAYLLFNSDVFDVVGLTVNRTRSGGTIEEQVEEAARVMKLCKADGLVPLLSGADGSFEEIEGQIGQPEFDGHAAVDFIISEAKKERDQPLVLLPVGKLTNIALALKKAPEIAEKVRIVWLGSNYPEPGEYNQDNDTAAMSYILRTDVPFEMVTVRYGKPSGTDAVRATPDEINTRMAGKGPQVSPPVIGRHGDPVSHFGAYSINLFSHIDLHGDPPARALFDMAAVAIVKNPSWAQFTEIPAPKLVNNTWIEQAENSRMMGLWENFDQDKIMEDFYRSMDAYVLVK